MTLKYGFYNAVADDRAYDAVDLSKMFDGIITDGVFQNIGFALATVVSTGMTVNVRSGKAWFNYTWNINDSDFPVVIPASDPVLNRIDTICLVVNTTARTNSITRIAGTPAASPVAPTLSPPGGSYYLPLSDIAINAGVTTLLTGHITNRVGTGSCPYVTVPVSVFQGGAPVLEHQIFS